MTQLQIDREFPASPERLWAAFTSAAALATWMWPGSWETTAEVDLRPGGSYRISSQAMGLAVSGQYVAIEPTTRLVQTWRWDGDEHETLVTITIVAATTGSRVTIVHDRLDGDEDAAAHRQGWNDCLDRLPDYLS